MLVWSVGNVKSSIPGGAYGFLKAYGDIAMKALMAFIFFGLNLSTYLPLVPAIIWIGAIATWLIVVIEAVIAAPLWALAHLDTDGDGMGGKTQHGYLFILNVLFRPTLMLFGFVLASVLVEIMGGLWTKMFATAISSAQGDSITGLFAVVAFVGIYMITCLSIVNTAFSAIHVVPDNVLGWIGGNMQNGFGSHTEDQVNSRTGSVVTAMGSQVNPGAGAAKLNDRHNKGGQPSSKGGENTLTDGKKKAAARTV